MINDKSKIKIALIGLGWVTREVWLPALNTIADFSIVALFDPDSSAAKKILDQCPKCQVCEEISQVAATQPDLVLIATPNKFHIEYAELFLNKDISVWIEKPICLSLNEYTRLQAAVKTSSGIFLPSSVNKFREDVACLNKLLLGGQMGKVSSMNLEWVRASGIPRPGSWFTNKSLAGGGVGYDLGWHMLDIGFLFLGYPDITEALGVGFSSFLGEKQANSAEWRNDLDRSDDLPAEVEDQFIGFLKTNNGVAVNIKVAWASHETVDLTRIVVNCERATLELCTTFGFSPNRIKIPYLKVLKKGKEEVFRFENIKIGAEYTEYVKDLLAAMRNKKSAHENVLKTYSVVKALDLMYRSFS